MNTEAPNRNTADYLDKSEHSVSTILVSRDLHSQSKLDRIDTDAPITEIAQYQRENIVFITRPLNSLLGSILIFQRFT